MSIHHKRHEIPAERRKRIAAELRKNHQDAEQALIDEDEAARQGIGKILPAVNFLNEHAFDAHDYTRLFD